MKKIVSLFAAIVMTVGIMSAMPLTVNAASKSSSDGLDVSMETSTNSYALNEDEQNIATEVEINVNVKNTNATDFTDVEVKLELPSGLMLKTGDLVESGISVPSGKTHKFTATAIHFKPSSGGNDDNKPTNEDDNPTNSDDSNEKANTNDTSNDIDSPKTGDSFSLASVLIVMLFSASFILVAKRRGMRIPKGVISLGLCLAIVAGAANITVFAAGNDSEVKTISVDQIVTINDTDYEIKVTVSFPCAAEDDVTLDNLKTNEIYFSCKQENSITFTVDVTGNPDSVKLFKDDAQMVGNMHDDGKNGDSVANDGKYTYVSNEKVDSDSYKSVSYYCQSNSTKSNTTVIYFFALPTAENTEIFKTNYNTVKNEIKTIESKYIDGSGYVPTNKYANLINDITSYLNKSVEDGIVAHYVLEDNKIYVKFTSGIASLYAPSTPNTDSIGSNVAMTVVTYQPCFTDMGGSNFLARGYTLPAGVNYVLEMPDDVAEVIDQTFANYTFSSATNYNDSQVSLDRIKSIGENQIVLWHGHGYYGPIVKSSLVTGEAFDWNKYYWDIPYFNNCVQNRFANGLFLDWSENVIITSKYIDKFCGRMNNSMIYLAACESGKDEGLANSFLNKGATAVVANTNKIIREYNVAMLYETALLMTTVNSTTNNYYNLSEALSAAKSIYGQSDSDRRYGGLGATPVIFGGNNANNYRFADFKSGTLSGKVCKASDRITPISGAVISVYQDSELIKTLTSNESGNYSIVLPVGDYKVKITAEGYMDFEAYAKIKKDETNYMETFLMVAESEATSGVAKGKVTNTLVGSGVEGVTLTFKPYWNNTAGTGDTVGTAVTDANGYYTAELPLGNYTAIATKSGFLESTFNIVVQEGTTDNQNGTITPIVSGDDFRITLTWGENPRDLDSHVEGTLSSGSHFHVYFSHKSQYDGDIEVCNLDYDDTTSYGPEHITLKTTSDKPYYYYIHRWAGSGTISSSSAKIQIHQGSTLIKEFNVPTSLGSGDYWNVFAIVNGRLVVRNTMTSSPETSYINADGSMVRGASTQNLQGSSDNMTSKETTSDEVSADSQTDAVSSSVESSAPESTEATVVSSEPASVSTEDVTSATEESSTEEYPISSSEDTAPATPKTQNQTATVPAQKEEADDVSPSDTNN